MILLIDNYDSFVYNLARYVGRLGRKRHVVRNDQITIDDIADMNPDAIILSPGPCTPKESGICLDAIKRFHRDIPILGICLGHQCIGEVFGGRTIRAPAPVHGKKSIITHDHSDLFMGLPSPMAVARYHSLITDLPANTDLKVTAYLQDDPVIMAVQHSSFPVCGLQFHPESILTEYGLDMIRNFLTLADEWNETQRHKQSSSA